jgi:myo-inositol catabolism protein IolC
VNLSTWRPSKADPLLILAMDHRESFGRTHFGVLGDDPTEDQRSRMAAAKDLIYAGLLAALPDLPGAHAGVLVDERYGAQVARAAAEQDVVPAVPIERSGVPWFGLEWGEAWVEHLQRLRPAYAKVLVRDNPGFPDEQRRAQLTDLQHVCARLAQIGIPLLYELLIPATDEQAAAVHGDTTAHDREVRPDLVVQVIADNQNAGVQPAIWKIEGLEDAEAARAVIAAARAHGRDSVDCVVLGRAASPDRLRHWLRVAAPVDGFVGFAIGRNIWDTAVTDHEQGRLDDARLSDRVRQE